MRMVGSRIGNYLGLKMDQDIPYKVPTQSSRDYAYIEIPVRELYNPSEEVILKKGSRNQYLKVVPACIVNVKGHYRFEVHPNPALSKYGSVQAPFYLEPEDGELNPGFYISLRRDLDIKDIDWAIRIYMRV